MKRIMKQVKKMLVVLFLVLCATGCIKDNFWYSGVSDGKFDGSLLEYLEAHSYDWDSTALMVHRAGAEMVRIFEGQDPDLKEITFFGLTNHSIRRYMLENGIKRVADMDPAWCAGVLKRHIVKGKIYRNDVPVGKANTEGAAVGAGGINYTALAGNEIHAYSYKAPYNDVAEMGAITVYLTSLDSSFGAKDLGDLASTNIEPNNCVVHSLQYSFTLGDM